MHSVWTGIKILLPCKGFKIMSKKGENTGYQQLFFFFLTFSKVSLLNARRNLPLTKHLNCGCDHPWQVGRPAASPILCPEHISNTMLGTVMKFHGWIDLIKAECIAQEP